jgi:hypothetical protein
VHKLVLGKPGRLHPNNSNEKKRKKEAEKSIRETASGQTINETYIENHHLSSGNDLIDDILSYYNLDPHQMREERIQKIRVIRQQEEERRVKRLEAREKKLKRRLFQQQLVRAFWKILTVAIVAAAGYYFYTQFILP